MSSSLLSEPTMGQSLRTPPKDDPTEAKGQKSGLNPFKTLTFVEMYLWHVHKLIYLISDEGSMSGNL